MKFLVETVSRAGERVGSLELGPSVCPTPGPLLVTRGGCLPHLTRETLAHLPWAQGRPAIAPLQYHIKQGPVLERHGGGLAGFLGLGEHPLLLSLHCALEELRTGYNRNRSVSVWQFGTNQHHVDPALYMEVVKQARPAAFLALCDGDTKPGCSNKKVSKSVSKSVEFLDSCLELAADCPALADTGVIAAVEGGLDLKARRKSAHEVSTRKVHGFLMDGFHHNGPDTENIVFDTFKEVLVETIAILPVDKPRFYFGAAPPHLVFDLVAAGVDVFDCTYPAMVTERDCVLVFPNSVSGQDKLPGQGVGGKTNNYELNMADEVFRLDLTPLVADCTCYTCQHFTRAYVHHLVMTKEMLSRVLLSLHNLHHYHAFYTGLQAAIRQGSVGEFRQLVLGREHNPAG